MDLLLMVSDIYDYLLIHLLLFLFVLFYIILFRNHYFLLGTEWQAFVDDNGYTYYYNQYTGENTYDPPLAMTQYASY
jgi:hypothetical protein